MIGLTKMKIKEFKKLVKQETPEKIITMYYMDQIYLTDKQLEQIIKLKNEEGKIGKKNI